MANIMGGSFDFSGYATKNDLLCSDGRTIRRNAFKDCDGKVVPLVWNHGGRTDPSEVLGHALLENRDDGVYMYGAFNGTEKAQIAKECVKNGDITGLSIYANSLKQKAGDVLHGVIREVSLVLSGANPGATIDFVMQHDSDSLDSFYYFLNGEECELKHSDDVEDPDDDEDDDDEDEETVGDVLKTLNPKQKAAVAALLQNAKKKACVKHSDDEEDDEDDDDDETVGDVLKSLTDKQKAAVAMMIEALTKNGDVKHSDYYDDEDDYYDDYDEDDYDDDEFEHADEEDSGRTVSEILNDLDDDESAAVEALLDAIESQATGKPSVAHSMLMHADEDTDPDEPTVGDVLLNMSDEKKAAVMTVIEDMTGASDDEDDEEDEEVEHSDYDDYYDDYDEDYYDDDEFEHADEEDSGRTVSEILNDLDDDESAAVEALLDAIESQATGKPSVAHSMLMHADEDTDPDEPTVGDVLLNMSDEKKAAVMTVIEDMTGASDDEDDEEDEEVEHSDYDYMEDDEMMRHAYDNYGPRGDVRGLFNAALDDIKRFGSLKDSVLAHAEEYGYSQDIADEWGDSLAHAYPHNEANQEITYGVADVEYLFPDARTLNATPTFIKRDTNWVDKFMNATHKSPFSRVKTIFANITADEARAKGYVKGNQKIDEVFTLLKRTTDPQTVYKKQSIDRDDILDITDFDVVVWIKNEMRLQLNEELARAALVGDGRPGSSGDKISELHIRSIYNDDALYSIKANVVVPSDADDDDKAKAFIKAAIKARKDYKGSGNPTLYTTSDMLTAMLLLEDGIGRALYSTEAELATKLRVKEIVEVPVMEGLSRADGAKTLNLAGIIVNPADYNFGADKGGQTSFFDDFDIDYNQQKYLLETRCSGALTVPYSAIVLELDASGDAAHTTNP